MASTVLNALKSAGTHAVGSINSIQVKTLAHGAKVKTADVDNWTLIELAGFDDEGQLCQQLSAKANKAYLVGTPEQRYLSEDIRHFYNAVGEFTRPIVLEPNYTRFETSAYSLNAGVSALAKGQVAHFDVATKKFIISDAGSAHADYATSSAQFIVVGDDDDTAGNFDVATVRLMCTKA